VEAELHILMQCASEGHFLANLEEVAHFPKETEATARQLPIRSGTQEEVDHRVAHRLKSVMEVLLQVRQMMLLVLQGAVHSKGLASAVVPHAGSQRCTRVDQESSWDHLAGDTWNLAVANYGATSVVEEDLRIERAAKACIQSVAPWGGRLTLVHTEADGIALEGS
jgi:hypothetical protein